MKPLPFTPSKYPSLDAKTEGHPTISRFFSTLLNSKPLQRYPSSGSQAASDGRYENQWQPEEWVPLSFSFPSCGVIKSIFPAIQHADAVSALTGRAQTSSFPPVMRKADQRRIRGFPCTHLRTTATGHPPPEPHTESGGSITTRKVPGEETGDPKLAERFKPALRTLSALPPNPASWRTSLPFSTMFQNSQPNISLCVFINSRDSRLA